MASTDDDEAGDDVDVDVDVEDWKKDVEKKTKKELYVRRFLHNPM
jgi:hypothetical protein